MARRRMLVTYDIADDRRRAQVFRVLNGFGDHLQYSVFLCQLNERERVALERDLSAEIHHREDQVLLVDLGPSERDAADRIGSLGRAFTPAARVVVV